MTEEFGDSEGHPFRGNQWTSGVSNSAAGVTPDEQVRLLESGQVETKYKGFVTEGTGAKELREAFTKRQIESIAVLGPNGTVDEHGIRIKAPPGVTDDPQVIDAIRLTWREDLMPKLSLDTMSYLPQPQPLGKNILAYATATRDGEVGYVTRAYGEHDFMTTADVESYRRPTSLFDTTQILELAVMAAARSSKVDRVTFDELVSRVAAAETALLALANQELGDSEGHPFRGNQYSGGRGGDGPPQISEKARALREPEPENGYYTKADASRIGNQARNELKRGVGGDKDKKDGIDDAHLEFKERLGDGTDARDAVEEILANAYVGLDQSQQVLDTADPESAEADQASSDESYEEGRIVYAEEVRSRLYRD